MLASQLIIPQKSAAQKAGRHVRQTALSALLMVIAARRVIARELILMKGV